MKKIQNRWYLTIWSEGKYVDFWSLNHFLAGFLLGQVFVFFKINFWFSLIFSLSLMVIWEIYEYRNDVKESIQNRVMDIVIGLISFLLVYFLTRYGFFDNFIFYIVFFVFLVLELWGYWAYKKKKK